MPLGLPRSLFYLGVSDNPLLSGRLPLDPMVHTKVSDLDIKNTDICVPGTPEFQQWLMGISFFGDSGMTCAEEIILPPPPPPIIPPPPPIIPPPPPIIPPPPPIIPTPLEQPEQQPRDLDRGVTGVEVTEEPRQLLVSWEEFTGASRYRVQWKSEDSQEFDQEDTVTGGSTTSYRITGLVAGIEYTVKVIAILSNNTKSRASEEVTGTPLGEELRPIPGPEQRSGGGCAIGSVVPGEVSQSALFNMLVVMSALLAASRGKKE